MSSFCLNLILFVDFEGIKEVELALSIGSVPRISLWSWYASLVGINGWSIILSDAIDEWTGNWDDCFDGECPFWLIWFAKPWKWIESLLWECLVVEKGGV